MPHHMQIYFSGAAHLANMLIVWSDPREPAATKPELCVDTEH